MTKRIEAIVRALLAIVCMATTASAQDSLNDDRRRDDDREHQQERDRKRDEDCEKAARIIKRGKPERKLDDAFLVLQSCRGSTASQALAAGLRSYSDERDPKELDNFMHFVDSWRDAAVFHAAVDVALSGPATAQARVFAVRHLLVLTNPYGY